MDTLVEAYRLLGDETRLRILRLLAREELNVSELTAILGIAQSGVSRHLKLLRDGGLVSERREGSWAYFSVEGNGNGPLSRVWQSASPLVTATGDAGGDLARLADVLRQRRERASSPFQDGTERLPVPGRSWIAWARALLMLVPPARVVDVGCGDGGLAIEMAAFAKSVTAVDRSAAALDRARQRARAAGATNIEFCEGELEALPLDDGSVDLCVYSQILHHAGQPQRAIDEAARVLTDGGRVLILDLAPHGEEWVRDRLGDVWLGFDAAKLRGMLERTGFAEVRTQSVPRQQREPFEVLVCCGVKRRR